MKKIREKIEQLKVIEDALLVEIFGNNIHDVSLQETIQTGVVDKLMAARESNVPYAVIVRGIIPTTKTWDKYGDGTWKPLRRGIITTYDIETPDNNRQQEEENIYAFLRGEEDKIISCNNGISSLSQVGKRQR